MNANELRISNWIADRGGKQWKIDHWESKNKVSAKPPVHEIDGHKFEGHPLTEEVEYLQPVLLTQEILLKCGFKYNLDDDEYTIGENDCFSVIFINNPNIIKIMYKQTYIGCESDYIIFLKFQYLHQLQNLYFALTNEELQIEL